MSSFFYWWPLCINKYLVIQVPLHYMPLKCPRWQVENIAKMIKMKLNNSSLQLWGDVGMFVHVLASFFWTQKKKNQAFWFCGLKTEDCKETHMLDGLWLISLERIMSAGFTRVTIFVKSQVTWCCFSVLLEDEVHMDPLAFFMKNAGVSVLMSTGNWDFSTHSKSLTHPWCNSTRLKMDMSPIFAQKLFTAPAPFLSPLEICSFLSLLLTFLQFSLIF